LDFLTDGLSDAVNSNVSGRELEKSLSKWSGFSYNLSQLSCKSCIWAGMEEQSSSGPQK